MMSLPPEKLSELRQLIHGRVSQLGVQEQIRSCLAETQEGGREVDEGALLRALEERGLVDQVMQSLHLDVGGGVGGGGEEEEGAGVGWDNPSRMEMKTAVESHQKATPLNPTKRYLFLQVTGGKAFLEHLQDSEDNCCATLTLHVHFKGQRFHSTPVPCACEPNFHEGFLLELLSRGGKDSKMLSYSDTLSLADPVHLVLTRMDAGGEVVLVGTCYLEWRQVLTDRVGRISVLAELNGVGSEAKIPAGLLELKLEILPKSEEVLHPEVVSTQLGLEKQRCAERERLFLVYARQWWKEYLQIRPAHSQRLVKIFAQDEGGGSHPVCAYVRPLRAGRLLDSPRHAARFVSLIPFERASSVGSRGCCTEVWSSLHATLSRKKGDCEDHAVLLCSLLLGFGLDAYMCTGTKAKGLAHSWVMTIGHEGTTTFWESLTGQRFLHTKFDPNTQAGTAVPLPSHPYRTVGCVFNHRTFYANAQPSDSVLTCRFDLNNGSLWKGMSPEAIASVTHGSAPPCWSMFPPLLPARIDPLLSSSEMEAELRTLTTQHRTDIGLSTVWDDELCYLLSPALSAYEMDRTVGVCAGNEEFQEAIHNVVPEGHTFKGFPIQLVHRNVRSAFATCLRSPVCAEILACRGDHIRMAVRVKIFIYPEDICAVWLMFAVKYRSIL